MIAPITNISSVHRVITDQFSVIMSVCLILWSKGVILYLQYQGCILTWGLGQKGSSRWIMFGVSQMLNKFHMVSEREGVTNNPMVSEREGGGHAH